MEKFYTALQATDDNIIRRMRTECWITTATNTHSDYVTYCFYTATMVTRQSLNSNASTIPTLPPMLIPSWTSLYVIYDQELNIHNLLMPAALATSLVPSHLLTSIN